MMITLRGWIINSEASGACSSEHWLLFDCLEIIELLNQCFWLNTQNP